MTIRLFEDNATQKTLTMVIEFSDRPCTISTEVQKGVVNHYDEHLNLVRIEISDSNFINPILSELDDMLKNSDVKIIRKAA